MKQLYALLALGLLLAAPATAPALPKPCRPAEKEVKGWRVLVSTDRCDGFFTMDYGVRATEECKKAQVGEREPMLMMVGATSGCKHLLPRAEYPSGAGHRRYSGLF
jgi:hypothetical protein